MTDAETDYLLARCSVVAYHDGPKIEQICASELRLSDPKFFSVGSVQAFIANLGDVVVVSFRGTEPDALVDWLRDGDVEQVDCDYGPGRVHRGYDFATAMAWKSMYADLVRREPLAVLCTGHSKGAAEATLFAARLSHFASMAVQLVTFGSPRVGDRRFSRWLRSQLVDGRRYVHTVDVVTRVPLFGLRFRWSACPVKIQTRYRHVGPASYIDANGRLLVDPPRLYMAADRLRARWRHVGTWGLAGIAAHDVNGYVFALRRAAE